MMRCAFALLSLSLAVPAGAAELSQIPAIVAGKKAKGADWKAAAQLEKIVQAAAKKAGHNLTALGGDAGKKALACKGNVDCLAKIAAGKPGYAVVIVVWALKNKRLGEVGLFDLATMKKIGGASGPIDDKLGEALVAAIPAPAPEPEPAPEPAVAAAEAAPKAAEAPAAGQPAAPAEEAAAAAAPEQAPAVATPAATASSDKTLSYALIGGGVAMIGGGAYFGMSALGLHNELTEPMSESDREAKVSDMKETALIADLLMFPGIAVAGAGAYMMLAK